MRLRIAEGQGTGQILTLKPDGFGIGRGQDSDLLISDEGVSRHHCRVCLAGGLWRVEDLNSTNGVSVNGQRIVGAQVLVVGDRIGIGKHVFVVEEGDAEVLVAAVAPLAPVLAAPTVTQVGPDAAVAGGSPGEPLWDTADLPPRRRFPWLRLALLVVLLGVIGTLAFLVFSHREAPVVPVVGAPAGVGEGSPGPPQEVTDAELDRLIADEEKAAVQPTAGGPVSQAEEAVTPKPAGGQAAAAAADGVEQPGPAEAGRAVVSDLVFVASDPSAATVTVDGKEQGVTPLLLRGLEKGRHRIVLNLDGYEEFERQIHVPDLLPSRPYALRARAGTLFVSSTAPGTAVWRGPQFLGIAPVLVQALLPGEHDLVLVAPGCESLRKTVSVSEVSSAQLAVDPKPQLGALEITTQPAGCTVCIEGALKGLSLPAGELATASAPLRFAGLRAGTYSVLVEHPTGVSRSGKLTVKPGETVSQAVRLWVPDRRVVLEDGTQKTGMIVERTEQGDIVFAETARQTEHYPKSQVSADAALTREETMEILRKQGAIGPSRAPEGKGAGKGRAEGRETPRAAGERRGGDAKAEDEGAGLAWGEEPVAAGRPDRPGGSAAGVTFTVDDFGKLLREESSTELSHRFKDRPITLRGKASGIGKDGVDSYISFGRRIRCYVEREAYGEAEREGLRTAVSGAGLLSVTGFSAGFRGDVLILRDCKAVLIADDTK